MILYAGLSPTDKPISRQFGSGGNLPSLAYTLVDKIHLRRKSFL